MKYIQKHNKILKSELEIDLQETGFNFTFTDKNFFGPPRIDNFLISYANITNQKVYSKRTHPSSKKIFISMAVILAVLFILFVNLSTNITYGTKYENYLNIGFYVVLASMFILYKFVALQKVVIVKENNGPFFTIFDDAQTETIIKDIIERRNKYLRQKYIDGDNYKTLTLESVEYLSSINVLGKEEANNIKEKIKPSIRGEVGFSSTS